MAGIIASLVGDNKMSIIEAAAAAAWLHGDIARKYGKGLISEDLIKRNSIRFRETSKKMREPKTIDVLLLILLGAIWGSAFFNIKIATYTYDPITLVFC